MTKVDREILCWRLAFASGPFVMLLIVKSAMWWFA